MLKSFFFFLIYFYFWLHWVFVAARGLSLAVASGVYSSLPCEGRLLLAVASLVPRAQALGMRASAAVACGL